jgi:hypothetical protein
MQHTDFQFKWDQASREATIHNVPEECVDSFTKYNENALDKSKDHAEIRLQAPPLLSLPRSRPSSSRSYRITSKPRPLALLVSLPPNLTLQLRKIPLALMYTRKSIFDRLAFVWRSLFLRFFFTGFLEFKESMQAWFLGKRVLQSLEILSLGVLTFEILLKTLGVSMNKTLPHCLVSVLTRRVSLVRFFDHSSTATKVADTI